MKFDRSGEPVGASSRQCVEEGLQDRCLSNTGEDLNCVTSIDKDR
jgi:hypothetical protein